MNSLPLTRWPTPANSNRPANNQRAIVSNDPDVAVASTLATLVGSGWEPAWRTVAKATTQTIRTGRRMRNLASVTRVSPLRLGFGLSTRTGQLPFAVPPERRVNMSRHFQVTFDAHDPKALSTFWRDVLGYVHPGPPGVELAQGDDPLAAWDEFLARVGVPEEQWNSRSAIEDPDGHGPRVFFQQVPEDKIAKNRVHLDVRAAPGLQGEERMAALEAECARLVALGANRVRRFEPAPPMSAGFIVMTDPEGNEFCLD